MEISRLIFTKETKEKIDKGISSQAKGKLRWDKLKEAENNGTLQQAKSRIDVGKIVGLDNDKTAYSWVSNMIIRGYLNERTLGVTPSGKILHEYSLTGAQPRYCHEGQRNKKTRKKATQELRQPVEQKKASSLIKLEITKGDITIRAEFAEVEQATNLITTIMKGE